jgi:hypothetical protein
VVFSAHDRSDAAKTPPASLAVTLTDVPQPPQPSVQPPQVVPPVAPPPMGSVSAPVPSTDIPQPAVNPPPAVQQALPQARTVTVGYAYPTVWLLPLAFLVLVPLVARSLTRDLTPRPA